MIRKNNYSASISQPVANEINNATSLFYSGKVKEAGQILINLLDIESLSYDEKILINTNLLHFRISTGKKEEAINIIEKEINTAKTPDLFTITCYTYKINIMIDNDKHDSKIKEVIDFTLNLCDKYLLNTNYYYRLKGGLCHRLATVLRNEDNYYEAIDSLDLAIKLL